MIWTSKGLTGNTICEKYQKLDLVTFETIHWDIKAAVDNYERAQG